MALPATDNFNRADVNPIGGNWTTVTSQAALQIVTNRCGATSNGTGNAAYWNADVFANDQYSSATLAVTGSLSTGVICRASAAAYTCYLFRQANSTVCQFYKFVAGVATQIGSDISSAHAQGDVLKLQLVGTTLTGYKNGSSIGTASDASIASGSAGVRIAYTNAFLDDWVGGDVAVGGLSIPVAMAQYRQRWA